MVSVKGTTILAVVFPPLTMEKLEAPCVLTRATDHPHRFKAPDSEKELLQRVSLSDNQDQKNALGSPSMALLQQAI